MFDIHSVEMTNFRSYKGKHVFEFPTAPGLYSLTGQNLNNVRLGANGVGKSTLLDAIHWCLYGRTPRGLKATDVVTWGTSKGCQVTVSLTVGQKRALVSRSQSPNLLTLNGEIIDQGAIQGLVRLSGDAFTASVMLPQFGQSFFDLAPAMKLSLFSKIMELEFWLGKSEAAKDASAQLERKRIALEQEMAKATGQIEGAEGDIVELREKATTFEKEQDERIKALEGELRQLMKDNKKDETNLQSIKKVLLGAEGRLATFAEELMLFDQQNEAVEKQRIVAEEQEVSLRRILKQLTGLSTKCPTCFQPVDKAHLKSERTKVENELETLLVGIDSLDKKIKTLETKINKVVADKEAVHQNKHDFEREQNKVVTILATTRQRLINLKAEIATKTDRPNPYESLLKSKEKLLKAVNEELTALKAKTQTVLADHAAVSYWVNGFKRVRLFIIEQALQQLEIEVNNNLTSLGLTDWYVEFDVERENKSGGITKGFVVLVHPPGHKEPIRYEAYSGGETQRLRLAGDLGLANLIMERAGLTNTIEFFDEPSTHLSQEGLLDLAETLNDRALVTGKRIWLIDHNVIDYGGFAGTYTVVKDENGSSIKEA